MLVGRTTPSSGTRSPSQGDWGARRGSGAPSSRSKELVRSTRGRGFPSSPSGAMDGRSVESLCDVEMLTTEGSRFSASPRRSVAPSREGADREALGDCRLWKDGPRRVRRQAAAASTARPRDFVIRLIAPPRDGRHGHAARTSHTMPTADGQRNDSCGSQASRSASTASSPSSHASSAAPGHKECPSIARTSPSATTRSPHSVRRSRLGTHEWVTVPALRRNDGGGGRFLAGLALGRRGRPPRSSRDRPFRWRRRWTPLRPGRPPR